MESRSVNPVASQERLVEIGLDPAEWGSCSAQTSKKVTGKVDQITNMGCFYHGDCPRKDMLHPERNKAGEMVMRHRPHHVRTTLVKPGSIGKGDKTRQNWCTCAQFMGGLAKEHGHNKVVAIISGDEGDPATLAGSRLIDGIHKPSMFKSTVPAFPDPEDNPDMFSAVYSAAVRDINDEQEEAARLREQNRRLGRASGAQVLLNQPEEATSDDLKAALARVRAGHESDAGDSPST